MQPNTNTQSLAAHATDISADSLLLGTDKFLINSGHDLRPLTATFLIRSSFVQVAATTKQAVAPLQALQVNAIKRRLNLFEIRQSMYRDQFKKMSFFSWVCENVYTVLDRTNRELSELEEERDKLQEQANLFELILPEFKAMRHARKELKQIKQLWDYVNVVRSCIDQWKTTPWKKIDVENMEMECKKFGKEIRQMDKELKGWDVYIQLEATIKNMLTSLRAVTELQNPAIRDRHWTQLMQATKVSFILVF